MKLESLFICRGVITCVRTIKQLHYDLQLNNVHNIHVTASESFPRQFLVQL